MRVLLTGATGFIGRHAVRTLAAAGHDVVALVRATSDRAGLGKVAFAAGDLSDTASLRVACQGADVVVHAAAVVRGHGRWADFQPGVDGTSNLLAAMRDVQVKRLVHLSSIGVYGLAARAEPLRESLPLCERPERWNHYVRQKVLSERVVWKAHEAGQIAPIVLRAAATLGPGDRASLPAIFEALRSGKMAVLGQGSNRVPFVVVDDLVQAITHAAVGGAATGQAYNLSGAEPITQAEFLGACAEALGIQPPARRVPVGFAKAAAAAAELLHGLARRSGPPPMTRLGVAVATCDLDVDCSTARRDLGWVGGGSYTDAIRRQAAWLRVVAAAGPPAAGQAAT